MSINLEGEIFTSTSPFFSYFSFHLVFIVFLRFFFLPFVFSEILFPRFFFRVTDGRSYSSDH